MRRSEGMGLSGIQRPEYTDAIFLGYTRGLGLAQMGHFGSREAPR